MPIPPAWNDEIESLHKTAFPDLSVDEMRASWDRSRKLAQMRDEVEAEPDKPINQVLRSSIPGVSAIIRGGEGMEYGNALKRFNEGKPEDYDYRVIATHEKRQRQEAEQGSTLKGAVGQAALHAPAFLGEMAMGGALIGEASAAAKTGTGIRGALAAGAKELVSPRSILRTAAEVPVMPSMWAEQWSKANMEAGRDPSDVRGMAVAMGLGIAQMQVMKAVGAISGGALRQEGLAPAIGRVGISGASGPFAQAAADVTSYGLGLQTSYGTLEQLANGDPQGAARAATVQALTFAAFHAAHERPWQAPEHLSDYQAKLQEMAKRGVPVEEAGRRLLQPYDVLNNLLRENPNPTRNDVRSAMEQLPTEDAREWGHAIAATFPERAAEPTAASEALAVAEGEARARGETTAERMFNKIMAGADPKKVLAGVRKGSPIEKEVLARVEKARQWQAMTSRQQPPPPPEPVPPQPAPAGEPYQTPFEARPGMPAAFPDAPRTTTALEPAQPPPQPETARPAQSQEPPRSLIHETVAKSFPDARTTPRGEIEADVGGRRLYVGLDEARNVARIDFEAEKPGVPAELQRGSMDLMRGIRSLVKDLAAQGIGVEYRAVDSNRGSHKKGRADIYARWLAEAGYEKVSEKAGVYEWRPKAEAPAEQVRTPPQVPTALEKLRERQAAGGKVEMGEIFKAAELTPRERKVMRRRFAGEGLSEIAKREGVSRQAIEQVEKKARAKLGMNDSLEVKNRTEVADEARRRVESTRERGGVVPEGRGEAEETGDVGMTVRNRKRLSAVEILIERAEKTMNEFDKEYQDAGGKLSPERQRYWSERFSREQEEDDRGYASRKGKPQEVAGGKRPQDSGEDGPGRGEVAQVRTPPQVEEPIVLTENQKRLQKRIQIMPKEPKQVLTDLVMNEKMDPETVLGMADEYRAAENQRIEDHNEMLKRSRQMLGKRGKVIHMERYEEPQQIKGFDEVADMMARRYPNLLGDNPEQALFDLLKQGNLKAPSMADAIRHAADQIREGAGGQPAPDTSFEFGAMADLAQKFAADEAGALDIDTAKKYAGVIFDHLKTAANHLNNSWKELAGEMAPRTSQLSRTTGEALSRYNATRAYAKEAAPYYIDKIMGPDATPEQRRLFGTAFQEMRHRYAREALAAEAERRTVEADQAAEEALALRAEMRAAKGRRLDRAARMWNEAKERATVASRAATKAQRDAESIKSLIGQDGSPIADEAGFEAVVGSPEFQGFLERWKAEFVPVMEQHFRQAQGLESDDPIDSLTQIPGLPMNAKAIRGDGPVPEGAVFIGQGRGNLKNLKIGKLKFAERATLAADGYDTDIGSIIENSLALGAQAARKAEMYRTAVAEGVGKWANPGQRIEGFREIPGTRPPKGTQEAAGNQVFYADHRVYDEMLRGLAVERPFDSPTSRNIAKAITLAALTSTAEATYHTKNLLTFLTKPGVSPKDVIGNAIRLWTNDPTAKRELMQLASIGALKEHGPETGNLWADPQTQALLKDVFGGAPPPKLDPTYWVGRALDFVDRTMRLTANQAFDRMEKAGLAQATEQNRRDFINQLGQYNSRAQHKWVAFFRNSGLGPFATAGTNYYVQGLRALTGETGLRATSFEAGVRLRAEQIARTLSIPIATFLLNYLMWGRVDGDDQTPIGAVKLGYDADKGRTSYYDLTAFTGLTRGARQVGLVALTEGAREGKSSSEIIDKGYEDAIHSALHPAIGPPVAFAYTAATGRNTMGRKVAEKGEPEAIQNLKAALSQANPAYSALSGADYPTKEVPWDERAAKLLGPFGPKYRYEKGRARPERLSR